MGLLFASQKVVAHRQVQGFAAAAKRGWAAFREGGSASQERAANADKTRAEAEDLRAHTAIGWAEMIRQMSVNTAEQTLLTGQLKGKIDDKE